jgi:transcriptional regulator with XRE-family HTH domain
VGSSELDRIAAESDHAADELFHGDLLTGVDILRENLKTLLSTLPHGGQLEFAKAIGVDPTTVSRWATGKSPPRREPNLSAIHSYFHLPSSMAIRSTPLFLEMDPIGSIAMRQWLHAEIDKLPADELNALYPALRKLMSGGGGLG